MDEGPVWIALLIAVVLIAGGIIVTVWHNIDTQARVQVTCIQAGGQWQNNTCVRSR